MTLRIAYDHQIFAWQRYGGISRYFVELASRVSAAPDAEARILAFGYVNEYLRAARPGLVLGIPLSGTGPLQRFVPAINTVAAVAGLKAFGPGIVHETYYGRWRLAPRSARVVVTVFDMIHERFPRDFLPSDRTAELKATAVARADHVVCISETTRQDLLQFLGVPARRTSVVYLGWNPGLGSVAGDAPVDGPFLLYVGLRGGYKNFARLLDAFAHSPALHHNFKLVAFGGGPFTTAELNAIARHRLDPSRVVQHSGDDLVLGALYRRASVLVYPSLYEGFGIPPLEAMACGCPVVCSRTGSLPEVVGPAAAYFDPADEESLRSAVEGVVASRERAAELVARGQERIGLFSWDRCARETLELYRHL